MISSRVLLGCLFLAPTLGFASEPDDLDFPEGEADLDDWVDDDGVPDGPPGDEEDESTCSLASGQVGLSFASVDPPSFVLPALLQGESWTVEGVGTNYFTRDEHLVVPPGSATVDTQFTYVPTQTMKDATAIRPLVVKLRALRKRLDGQILGVYPLRPLLYSKFNGTHSWKLLQHNPNYYVDPGFLDFPSWYADLVTPTNPEPFNTTGGSGSVGSTVDVNVCVWIQTSFTDFEPNNGWDGFGREDFFFDDSNKQARGVYVGATSINNIANGGSDQHFAGAFLNWKDNEPLSASGGGVIPAGCTVLDLVPGETYEFKAGSILEIDHIELNVLDGTFRKGITVTVLRDLNATPGSAAETRYTVPATFGTFQSVIDNGHVAWNMAAMLGFGLYRKRINDMNLVEAYWDDSPIGCTTCANRHKLFVDETTLHEQRFPMLHEMGHVVAYYADDQRKPNFSYKANASGSCDANNSHQIEHEEWASAAAVEGMAHFYAGTVLNKQVEFDCQVVQVGIDFNNDGAVGQPVTGNEFFLPHSCEDGPYLVSGIEDRLDGTAWDDGDYMEQECEMPGPDDRHTPYDWMRFFWDLDTDQSFTFGRIMRLWNNADPHNWDKNSANMSDPDKVRNRLILTAGPAVNRPNEVSIEAAANGVHR
ncbi:MAG: hypothetical protein AAGA48_02925 [Myxococcota bacterium]